MFKIENENIYLNRGDAIKLKLTLSNGVFSVGDVVKMNIVRKNDYSDIVFTKSFTIEEEGDSFILELTETETKLEGILKKGTRVYWYEIELNGNTTIIGYDENGAKEFVLYPEAAVEEA